MKQKHEILFQPIKIRNVEIKNRISMAPLMPMGCFDDNRAFNQRGQEYYIERAKGGTGLIYTGVCHVMSDGEGYPLPNTICPTVNPQAFVVSCYEMTERIHAYGAKIFLQIGAGTGRNAFNYKTGKRIAPSDSFNRWDNSYQHRAMTVEEIHLMIQKFGESAALAKQGGFDGVEVHAVHEGYLLDQFATAFYNHRTDEYGGSLENRLRFAIEVLQEIRKTCGEDFPVTLRYSVKSFIKDYGQAPVPGEKFVEKGKDLAEGIVAAQMLEAAGYDAFNVDVGTYDSWYWNHPPMYFEDGMYLPYSKIVKDAVSVPVLVAGRMDNPDCAAQALQDGMADMISLGRPLLADPYWPHKVFAGQPEEIRPCLSCHEGCQGRIHKKAPLSCAVNPACGREGSYGLLPALVKKKIMIVGGGLAGMELARTAALRGHQVEIFEAGKQLGGNIIPGGVPAFKKDDRKLLAWYQLQLQNLQVPVHFNTLVDLELIKKNHPDALIVATGSTPKKPAQFFNQEIPVYTADEVLLDLNKVQEQVLIIGGGLVGCETALYLQQQGKKVTVVEIANDVLGGPDNLTFVNYQMLKDLLAFHGVQVLLESQVTSIGSEVVITSNQQVITKHFDTVVVAVGYESNNSLYQEAAPLVPEIYLLGDARRVKTIQYAIWDAYEVGRTI